ncbi:MAG: putative membrane protein, partial [uncultured Solirubrobacteraceae bacterium]
ERRPRRPPRRRRGPRARGRRLGRRRRRRRGTGEHEGRRRDRRRRRGHPALRPGLPARARAADDQADRGRLAEEQAALHPARRAAALGAAAVAAHADPHDRRDLPLLRRRGEAVGGRRPALRARGGGRTAARRGGARRRRDPHRLHPLRRDHGHLAQRGEGRGAALARGDPRARGAGDHRRRLRRGRADREDGRHRAQPGEDARGRGRVVRARARARDADRAQGPLDRGDRRDALGRRAHHPRRARRARPPRALRRGAPPRGRRPRRARRGRRRRRVADEHRGVGAAGARGRRDRRGGHAPPRLARRSTL